MAFSGAFSGNRRMFLQGMTLGAGIGWTGTFCTAQTATAPRPLRVALIGCGGRGVGVLLPLLCREKVVALVDPDLKRLDAARAKIHECDTSVDLSQIRTYRDYPALFQKMGDELDAVVIATPNHHHAQPTLFAVRRKISVYVEKPMARTIAEARAMLDEAKKYGVVTQVGQHGHSNEAARRLCEYVWAGAIGPIHEVYCWDDRINGLEGERPNPEPVPEGLDWKAWLGDAPYREYHPGLHPHDWHSWVDFGNGSIGNMGNHILDPVFWSLKLGRPTEARLEDVRRGLDGAWPVRSHIVWKFAQRENMAPVTVHWYDGLAGDLPMTDEIVGPIGICRKREFQNLPPIVPQLEEKYGVNLGRLGSVLLGEKGVLVVGPFGETFRLLPDSLQSTFPEPPKTLSRVEGSHMDDFFRACRGGEPACANFTYSEPLTEMVLLGNEQILGTSSL